MKLRVAILSYNTNKYSETFIQNQVKHLPADVHYLSGGEVPELDNEGGRFLKAGVWDKFGQSIREVFLKQSLREQHLMAIEKYFLANKIQVVMANFSITAFPVMEICRRNKIPLIVHFHGWTAYRKTVLDQYSKQYSMLFETAAAIIGVSKDMLLQLEKIGAPPNKLHHLVCGYDEEIFAYKNHSNNRGVLLSMGRFCDTKNPHLTILAFKKALEQIPDAKLVMCGGDENLLNSCIGLIKALNLEDKVIIKGILSPQQVKDEMDIATALVLSSATTNLGEKEGTPVTILEAMASGLPVIATRHGGIVDVIEHEHTGLLSDEFDIHAMADNMVRIHQSATLAQKIGKNASEVARQKYSLNNYIKELMQIIEMLVRE